MKYMLLMYANEAAAPKSAEEFQALAKEWQAFATEAKATGAMLNDTGGLSPVANATTVRVRNDRTLTADGPFAETHEQLGGVFLFECKDLDEAVCWAAKIPTAKCGSIEIRPLWSQQG
jgi:hypothetical protein